MKNREFDKKAPQNFHPERATIAERQGASEGENSEEKPTRPKTDSSSYIGIVGIIWGKSFMKDIVLAVIGLAIAMAFTTADLGSKRREPKKNELVAKQTIFEKERHPRRW